MAKLSLKQREAKREKLVAKYAKKYAELKAVINDAKKSDEERYAGPPGAAEAAPQRQPDPPAQPLRADRVAARHVPHVRPRPQQDPRARLQGRHPGRGQGQLVTSAQDEQEIPP
jgi:hypothetical protein